MPVITDFLDQPLATPGPPQIPTLDISRAGAAAEALARGAAGVSDEMAGLAARYADQKRAVAASDAMVGVDNQLGDMAHRWSKVPDMDKAVAGFNDEANGLRKSAVTGTTDPFIQSMVAQRFDEARIAHSFAVRTQSFNLEASTARGALDQQLQNLAQTAAMATTPEQRAMAIDDGDRAIAARSPLYLAPDEAAKEHIAFRSRIQQVSAEQERNAALASRDPEAARVWATKINDPSSYPGMLPQVREQLGQRAETIQYRLAIEAASRTAHADAMAERNLRRDQQGNELDLLQQIYDHKPPTEVQLEDLARAQRISAGGLLAIHSAMTREQEGTDDALLVNELYSRMRRGEDIEDIVHDGIIGHGLSNRTAIELMKANTARDQKGESAEAKSYFAELKTVAGGHAVESGQSGFFKDPAEQAQHQALWAEAQGEWTRRVTVGGQAPAAVYADMAPRFSKVTPGPAAWPNPRYGVPRASSDVGPIWARTIEAMQKGEITNAQYLDEADLLDRYHTWLVQDEERMAAVRANAARLGGGGKAKLHGVTIDGEPQ